MCDIGDESGLHMVLLVYEGEYGEWNLEEQTKYQEKQLTVSDKF